MTKELKVRIITALALAALFFLAAVLSCTGRWGRLLFALLACISSSAAGIELALFTRRPRRLFRVLVLSAMSLLPQSLVVFWATELLRLPDSALLSMGSKILLAAFVVESILLWAALFAAARDNLKCGLEILPALTTAFLLIGTGGSALTLMALCRSGWRVLLWLLLVVCLNDVGAYFAGSRIGGQRIAPAVSPGKTLIGCMAGLLAGIAAGVCTFTLLPFNIDWAGAVIVAAVLVLAAQCGDAAKSFLKRLCSVKDSSRILPGHGGVLDRIDGVLLAAPLMLMITIFLGN